MITCSHLHFIRGYIAYDSHLNIPNCINMNQRKTSYQLPVKVQKYSVQFSGYLIRMPRSTTSSTSDLNQRRRCSERDAIVHDT